jgi:hypothetical protein
MSGIRQIQTDKIVDFGIALTLLIEMKKVNEKKDIQCIHRHIVSVLDQMDMDIIWFFCQFSNAFIVSSAEKQQKMISSMIKFFAEGILTDEQLVSIAEEMVKTTAKLTKVEIWQVDPKSMDFQPIVEKEIKLSEVSPTEVVLQTRMPFRYYDTYIVMRDIQYVAYFHTDNGKLFDTPYGVDLFPQKAMEERMARLESEKE